MEDIIWLKSVFLADGSEAGDPSKVPTSEGGNGIAGGSASPPRRDAGVLLLLDKKEGHWNVLLTVRSQHLRRHPGEVCLPGGMREEEDASIVETALRESFEEVGLQKECVEVICTLQPIRNRSNIIIYPVVALLTQPFIPSGSEEVDDYFWMKMSAFLSAENHSCLHNTSFEVHSFTAHGANVFGITSFICILAAVAIYDRYPEFPMSVFQKSEKSPREALAVVLGEGIAGYQSLHRNKL